MIKKVIIPVAGLGTRFLPATKAQPKEMLTVVDKPVVQYLVEEAVDSGIREIIFVTGRTKRAIEDHFDSAPELEHRLAEKGKMEALKQVRHISGMANFTYVRQQEQRGDGDAILVAAHLIDDGEPVAVLFGDDLVCGPRPALRQLMDVYDRYGDSVVALEEVLREEVSRYGIVDPACIDGRTVRIKGFVEKPEVDKAPSNLAAVGKYIITPDVIQALRAIKKGKGEELRLADAFTEVCKKRSIYGYKLEGKRYDCGSKLGFLKATVDFALWHEEVGSEFLKFLKGKTLE